MPNIRYIIRAAIILSITPEKKYTLNLNDPHIFSNTVPIR